MAEHTYAWVGPSTYELHDEDGTVVGTVWRTRTGWSGRIANGPQVVTDYGSRDAASNVLRAAADDQVGVADPDGVPAALVGAVVTLTDDSHLGRMVGTRLLVAYSQHGIGGMMRRLAEYADRGDADSYAWEAIGRALAECLPSDVR